MTRTALLMSAFALAPSLSLAADVRVDVRVTADACDTRTAWVEFRPDRGAYVALYASFSDGTLRPVFPIGWGGSHWVGCREPRKVPVVLPHGARLESVQAVASEQWFDPAQCWIARVDRCDPGRPAVTVFTTSTARLLVWDFRIGFDRRSQTLAVVRSWCGAPETVRSTCRARVPGAKKATKVLRVARKKATRAGTTQYASSLSGVKTKTRRVLVGGSGTKTSTRSGSSGEPEWRSRR